MIPFQPDNSTGQPGGSTFLDRMLARVADSITSLKQAVTNDTLVTAKLDNLRDWPVTHGLGKAVTTWEVVDRNANAVVWQPTTVNQRPTSFILLRASAAVTVKLRFT